MLVFILQFLVLSGLFLGMKLEELEMHLSSWWDGFVYPIVPFQIDQRSLYIPITNKFESNIHQCKRMGENGYNPQNTVCGDFHIVMYRNIDSEHKGKVIIRRIDDILWDFPITLTIFDLLNVKSDTIYIPKSSNSSLMLQFQIHSLSLQADEAIEKTQLIPKEIIQTFASRQMINEYHWNAFFTFVDLNPEYKITFMIDRECREFIKSFYDDSILRAYDSLIPTAFKADLFRYLYLYQHGGCYFDNKMINKVSLRYIIKSTDAFLVCSDRLAGGLPANTLKDTNKLYNAVICSVPKDDHLLSTIKYVLNQIRTKSQSLFLGFDDLAITGPTAFYQATRSTLNESNVILKHGLARPPTYTTQHPNREYFDYYIVSKQSNEVVFLKAFKNYYSSSLRSGGGYSQLWKDSLVFYDQPLEINSRFKIFPYSRSRRYFDLSIITNGDDIINESIQLRIRRKAITSTILHVSSSDDIMTDLGKVLQSDVQEFVKTKTHEKATHNHTHIYSGNNILLDTNCSRVGSWIIYYASYKTSRHRLLLTNQQKKESTFVLRMKLLDHLTSEDLTIHINILILGDADVVVPLCLNS